MEIVILSDNHSNWKIDVPTPKEDMASVLIHCGDWSYLGSPDEMVDFRNWLARQPHTHKLFVWGNHEKIESQELYWKEYLEEVSGVKCIHNTEFTIDGVRFFGSSYTPIFLNWAFMKDNEQRKRYWENAPDDIDILVTHGPPFGLLDVVEGETKNLGCVHLRNYVERVKPKLACFGHIHTGHGQMTLKAWDPTEQNTLCVNASLLDERYKMVNEPVVITI